MTGSINYLIILLAFLCSTRYSYRRTYRYRHGSFLHLELVPCLFDPPGAWGFQLSPELTESALRQHGVQGFDGRVAGL